MPQLKDLFVTYKGLVPKKKEEAKEEPNYSRWHNIISLLDRYKSPVQEEQPVEEPQAEEPQIEEIPVYQQPKSKYGKMADYSDSKKVFNTAFKFFSDKGLTFEQIAGLLGNLFAESSLNPRASNLSEKRAGYSGFGRGIAQWSNSRVQDFETYTGTKLENSTLDQQFNFIWYELQQRPELMRQLQYAETPEEAADLIYRGYENGSTAALATPDQLTETYSRAWENLEDYPTYNYYDQLSIRQKHARRALDLLYRE